MESRRADIKMGTIKGAGIIFATDENGKGIIKRTYQPRNRTDRKAAIAYVELELTKRGYDYTQAARPDYDD